MDVIHKSCTNCLLAVVVALTFVSESYSQTCQTPDQVALEKFPANTTVNYSFENIPAGAERSQIVSAIQAWNAVTSLVNCRNITFQPGEYVPGPYYPPGTAYMIIKYGSVPNQGAARADPTVTFGNDLVVGTLVINNQLSIGGILFFDPNVASYSTIFKKVALHEIGHFLGLSYYTRGYEACTQQTRGASVMNDPCGVNDNGTYTGPNYYTGNNVANSLTACDTNRLPGLYPCPTPTPTPSPTPEPDENSHFECSNLVDNDGDGWIDCDDPGCAVAAYCIFYDPDSPIVVDIAGNGFDLTSAAEGVQFDIDRDGVAEQLSWTAANTDDSWLVLDRNNNGTIDDGGELFGNHSPQPVPPVGEERNGFLALAEYDKLENGGNGDSVITRGDGIFDDLRLWRDRNHNGVSEPRELFTLPQLGLRKLHLDYQESSRVDEHGNRFKYRAKVKTAQDAQLGRWAWDVFLVRAD
jgi:hypothetical protein